MYLLCHHNTSTHVFRDVILYATLRGCISVGDALIDVWFSLLWLSYSLAHTYKFLKELFFHALWTLRLIYDFTNTETLVLICFYSLFWLISCFEYLYHLQTFQVDIKLVDVNSLYGITFWLFRCTCTLMHWHATCLQHQYEYDLWYSVFIHQIASSGFHGLCMSMPPLQHCLEICPLPLQSVRYYR